MPMFTKHQACAQLRRAAEQVLLLSESRRTPETHPNVNAAMWYLLPPFCHAKDAPTMYKQYRQTAPRPTSLRAA